MKRSKFYYVAVILLTFIVNVNAQDWPQYMGPDRNNTSSETGILRSWPESGPEVLWTVSVGIGYGGPVIKDGKVYLLDRDDKVGDMMRCFDFSSGEELWRFSYDAPGSVMFPGSRSVPTVDGNYIFSCGPFGDLYCIDINTHEPVWNKNVWTDYRGIPGGGSGGGFGSDEAGTFPTWAITQCPLVYGDLLIVASQAPEAGVVAYEKTTGDVVWKTASLGPVGYVSPTIINIAGEDHVVMVSASAGGGFGRPTSTFGKIAGIEPLTGEILWEYSEWECRIPVATAVDAGNNKVLVVGGYELGTVMLQIERKADGNFGVTELFKHEDFGGHTKPPILYNSYFYGQYTTNNRRDGLVCMNMDGEVMWKTGREPEFNKGGMILVDGLILATDGTTSLYVIEPDPSGFEPLASAKLLAEGGTGSENDPMASRVGGATQNWGPLALVDGKLLIRDQGKLMCVKVAQ